MSDLVRRLDTGFDHSDHASGLALDARGTEYERRVWDLPREVPAGQTPTYGAIAAKMGTPHDAPDVTQAIAPHASAVRIPFPRGVHKDRSLSRYRWGFSANQAHLAVQSDTRRVGKA